VAATQSASDVGRYAQRLLDNDYAQEQLGEAVESLRAAYRRASKRRVEPARDEKLRRQVREAVQSLAEAGQALKSGRRRPKRRLGRRLLVVVGLGAVGAAAAVALSDEFRERLLGGDDAASAAGDGIPPGGGT
jgi:hypothetical protein